MAPIHDEFVASAYCGLGAETLCRADHAFVRGLAFVLAVAAEFRRAAVATHRYEQLKRMPTARDEPAADIARRIYMEFYSDG